MVALQRREVIFITVLLRYMRTYLVGLRPANLLSLHFHFYFHLSIYMYQQRSFEELLLHLLLYLRRPIAHFLIILQALSCMFEYLDIVSLCLEAVGCRNLDPLCIAIVMSRQAGRCGFEGKNSEQSQYGGAARSDWGRQ